MRTPNGSDLNIETFPTNPAAAAHEDASGAPATLSTAPPSRERPALEPFDPEPEEDSTYLDNISRFLESIHWYEALMLLIALITLGVVWYYNALRLQKE